MRGDLFLAHAELDCPKEHARPLRRQHIKALATAGYEANYQQCREVAHLDPHMQEAPPPGTMLGSEALGMMPVLRPAGTLVPKSRTWWLALARDIPNIPKDRTVGKA